LGTVASDVTKVGIFHQQMPSDFTCPTSSQIQFTDTSGGTLTLNTGLVPITLSTYIQNNNKYHGGRCRYQNCKFVGMSLKKLKTSRNYYVVNTQSIIKETHSSGDEIDWYWDFNPTSSPNVKTYVSGKTFAVVLALDSSFSSNPSSYARFVYLSGQSGTQRYIDINSSAVFSSIWTEST
jgi:hypothetical protein